MVAVAYTITHFLIHRTAKSCIILAVTLLSMTLLVNLEGKCHTMKLKAFNNNVCGGGFHAFFIV